MVENGPHREMAIDAGAVNGNAGSPGKPVPPPREPPRPPPAPRNINNNSTAEPSKEPTKQQLDSIKKYQVVMTVACNDVSTKKENLRVPRQVRTSSTDIPVIVKGVP
ncbi:unnamed protein product [Nezara viridula]|uniref:Uncharacterized protein n=1 Tax=Nezara viridula TaxID=85310 RepID=A0A9P0HIY8_NEZVI|nr:unnamed protein product [Nezara viridula]